MRLDKFVNDITGEGRSVIKRELRSGKVRVNGIAVKTGETQVDPQKDVVTYEDRILRYAAYHYYVMNKPAGYVSAARDSREPTVMDLLQEDIPAPIKSRLFVAGRLDKDTEGLLLLTDDGTLTHRILSPKNHIEKTYYCRLAHDITDDQIEMLRKGVDIGEKRLTKPAVVKRLSGAEIELAITEGKFHQVKRMLAAADNSVTYLRRIRMGAFLLPEELSPGAYRALTDEEMKRLYA